VSVRALGFLAVGILLFPIIVSTQALPPRDRAPGEAPTGTARRFHIPSVFGRVLFRTNPLPLNVMLKSVTLNGVDITNTPFDATRADDVADLQVILVDRQCRISGFARSPRGEIQYNYRLIVYRANLKQGEVTVRFQHNTSPNVKGQFNIGRMPPGEYVGLAVKGVQPLHLERR
jgi:hypothetical protein